MQPAGFEEETLAESVVAGSNVQRQMQEIGDQPGHACRPGHEDRYQNGFDHDATPPRTGKASLTKILTICKRNP